LKTTKEKRVVITFYINCAKRVQVSKNKYGNDYEGKEKGTCMMQPARVRVETTTRLTATRMRKRRSFKPIVLEDFSSLWAFSSNATLMAVRVKKKKKTVKLLI